MKTSKPAEGFQALELKLTDESKNSHFVYFKEHSIREQNQDKPSGRTLFVVNVPPYADEAGIKNAFSEAGKIETVKLMVKPASVQEEPLKFNPEPTKSSFQIAYIVFNKVSELDNALKLKKLRPMNYGNHKVKCGMTKWIAEYNNNVYQTSVLKQQIDEFMSKFDKQTQVAMAKEKQLDQEDDEGWVTVTRKGKVNSFARSAMVEDRVMAKEELGKQRKELQNFYTFQIRESKMKHIMALRQKFEEDKKKVAQIKESRRFKPF